MGAYRVETDHCPQAAHACCQLLVVVPEQELQLKTRHFVAQRMCRQTNRLLLNEQEITWLLGVREALRAAGVKNDLIEDCAIFMAEH